MDYENQVICGDSLEVMQDIPDNSIDCVITDPPYGINENPRRARSRSNRTLSGQYQSWSWDKMKISQEYFTEILRVSKKQVIFGATNYANWLPANYGWIVWNKDNGDNDFSDCELAYTSFLNGIRKFKWRWQGMLQERMGKYKEKHYHPTQKPLSLFKWIIDSWTNPNDLILDPFLGSGTTAVACKELGRRFIGIEINPDYCEIARERLKQGVLNLSPSKPKKEKSQKTLWKDQQAQGA